MSGPWVSAAACRRGGWEDLDTDGRVAVCGGCPALAECRQYGIMQHLTSPIGSVGDVYAGLTPLQFERVLVVERLRRHTPEPRPLPPPLVTRPLLRALVTLLAEVFADSRRAAA